MGDWGWGVGVWLPNFGLLCLQKLWMEIRDQEFKIVYEAWVGDCEYIYLGQGLRVGLIDGGGGGGDVA